MAKSTASRDSDPPAWNPGKFALWSQRWEDPNDAYPTAVLLRHPTDPFTRVVEWANDDQMQKEMQKVAFAYLDRASKLDIDPRFELAEDWLLALNPDSTPDEELTNSFGWLPIGWPPNDAGAPFDPLASLRVERMRGDKPLPDQTVILLASQRLGKQHFLGPGFGVRVVAHVRSTRRNEHEVRITGASASLPYGDYIIDVRKNPRTTRSLLALYEQFGGTVTGQIEQTLGLQYVAIRNIRIGRSRVDGTWRAKLRGTGLGKTTAKKTATATSYVFVYLVTFSDNLDSITQAVPVLKSALVADAAPGQRRMFPGDPASQGALKDLRLRRTTRSQKQLDKIREVEDLADDKKNLAHFPLQYPRRTGQKMKVVICPGFVRDDVGPRGAVKTTDLSGRGPDVAIRSNDFTAVSAFKHVKQLFERLEAYGISADAYFRLAKLPLKVAYRSGVRPGPGKDGRTVNARVLPEYLPDDLTAPEKKAERPGLEMHLALANLSHGARKPSSGKPSAVEPLGIATDVRWIWHEIGHVLLMASLGELEFRFAHSPGDALAAIVADPRSKLAADPNPSWRGVTFPWVFIPRRHDRSVLQGWSWGGSLHRAGSNSRRKGYWTEQILSSSLFRLYQCLGGDTPSLINIATKAEQELERERRQIRESASHYSVYLIMRGLQLLGSPGVVPADNPDHFVSALIDADIGTGQWDVIFRPGAATKFHRVGGCAHKVIRWAFEAQGMYGPDGKINNAPGLPPSVDIYIANHRPSVSKTPYGDIDYGPGNYLPVPLYWDRKQGEEEPLPWQATADAIVVQGNDIRVTVGNRGSQPANDVKVSVWCREWPRNIDPPTWPKANGVDWTPCDSAVNKGKTIAPGYAETFGPFSLNASAGKRYLVLAQATCADDRANTDTETSLPCSYLETPLIDLVAGDNNLGLRVIKAT